MIGRITYASDTYVGRRVFLATDGSDKSALPRTVKHVSDIRSVTVWYPGVPLSQRVLHGATLVEVLDE